MKNSYKFCLNFTLFLVINLTRWTKNLQINFRFFKFQNIQIYKSYFSRVRHKFYHFFVPVYSSFRLAIHPIRQTVFFDRFYVFSTNVVSFMHRLLVDSRGIIWFGLSCSWNKVIFRFSAVAQRVVQSRPKRCWKTSGSGHARDLSPRTSYQRTAHFERVFAIISRVLIKRGNFLAGIYSNSRSFFRLTMRKERFRIGKYVYTKLYAIFIPSNPDFVHFFVVNWSVWSDWSKSKDFREYINSWSIVQDIKW